MMSMIEVKSVTDNDKEFFLFFRLSISIVLPLRNVKAYWSFTIKLFNVISGALVRRVYSSAEIPSVYSTDPAD